MQENIILPPEDFEKSVHELAGQIVKRNPDWNNVAIIGIQQGGVLLADEMVPVLKTKSGFSDLQYGQLDITFYRDDLHRNNLTPDRMNLPFDVNGLHIILVDDVLFTGRTIKAALDALLDYGRPARVELCVLADRKEHRQFPIQPDYVGIAVPSAPLDKVKLQKDDGGRLQVVLKKEENQ